MDRIKHPQQLGSRLGEPDTCAVSLLVLFEGWLDDLLRLHRSASEHLTDWELVVVDNPVDDEASAVIAGLERVVHVPLRQGVGYGAGRNLAMTQAGGSRVVIIDTSVELVGPLDLGLLDDPGIGVVGRWGLRTDDGFDFVEDEGPDVHAVEGYLMAMRRADIERVGTFDPKFRFYRNADIDHSFRIRDVGLRAVVDPTLPVIRHEHRLWESTPDRDELSKKNFARFRRRWGDRDDLFAPF